MRAPRYGFTSVDLLSRMSFVGGTDSLFFTLGGRGEIPGTLSDCNRANGGLTAVVRHDRIDRNT